jgi:hypothetical protein
MEIDLSDSGFVNRANLYLAKKFTKHGDGFFKDLNQDRKLQLNEINALSENERNDIFRAILEFKSSEIDSVQQLRANCILIFDQALLQYEKLIEPSKNRDQINRLRGLLVDRFLKSDSKDFKVYLSEMLLSYFERYSGYKLEQSQPAATMLLNLWVAIQNNVKPTASHFLKLEPYRKQLDSFKIKYALEAPEVADLVVGNFSSHDFESDLISFERLISQQGGLTPKQKYQNRSRQPFVRDSLVLELDSPQRRKVGLKLLGTDQKSTDTILPDFMTQYSKDIASGSIVIGEYFEIYIPKASGKRFAAGVLAALPFGKYKVRWMGDEIQVGVKLLNPNEMQKIQNSKLISDDVKKFIETSYQKKKTMIFVKDPKDLAQNSMVQKYLIDPSLEYLPNIDLLQLDQGKLREYYELRGMHPEKDGVHELRLALAHNLYYQKKDPTPENLNVILDQMNGILRNVNSLKTYENRSVIKYESAGLDVSLPNFVFKLGNTYQIQKSARLFVDPGASALDVEQLLDAPPPLSFIFAGHSHEVGLSVKRMGNAAQTLSYQELGDIILKRTAKHRDYYLNPSHSPDMIFIHGCRSHDFLQNLQWYLSQHTGGAYRLPILLSSGDVGEMSKAFSAKYQFIFPETMGELLKEHYEYEDVGVFYHTPIKFPDDMGKRSNYIKLR